MLFSRISRNTPEQIWAIFRSSAITDLVDGDLVQLDFGAPNFDAVVGSGTTVDNTTIVGVVSSPGKPVIPGEAVRVQIYGPHKNVKAAAGIVATNSIKSSATSNSVGAGTAADHPIVQLGFALTNTASGRISAFLRCM